MVRDESCSELLSWAASRGITDRPRSTPPNESASSGSTSARPSEALGYTLRIADFPDAGGRGLAATRDLKEGELILRVPKLALMSVLSAAEDPQLAKAIALHLKLSSTQILTVHLLNEVAKGKVSPWYTYLVKLPRVQHTLGHFPQWTTQALQVDDAIWVAQRSVEKAKLDYKASTSLMQAMGLSPRFKSFKAWLWASATVSSRTLHVPWDEAGTLCPIGDLFNYAPPGEPCFYPRNPNQLLDTDVEPSEIDDDVSLNGMTIRERLRDGGYEPGHNEYCFYAHQDYQIGQQVLLCYGLYNNLELLEHYGFCMAQNPNDNVPICLPDCTEFGWSSENLTVTSTGIASVEVNGSPSFSLLSGLRLRAIHPALRKARRHTALMGEQISKESDVLVYEWLRRKCESLLASLLTSLEDDLTLSELVGSVQDIHSLMGLYNTLCEGNDTRGQPMADHQRRQDKVMCELEEFLRSCGVLTKNVNICEGRVTTSERSFQLELWKLALEWRIGYKCVLRRSSLFCSKKIKQLKNDR